ncbi:MAG: hypothetical protein IT424_15500 [Pirellulales bacterium]|nr:hypothetical protein [Pirellulales bacterium]
MTASVSRATLILLGLVALSSCGANDRLSTVAGTVSVDGQPVEQGVIHFQSTASPASSGGATVSDGQYRLAAKQGLAPGDYTVVLQAFRKTGRTINDPQKGPVAETASIPLSEPSQTVTLSADNASDLSLNFAASPKR